MSYDIFMYELMILALLMRGPTHGYVITGILNDLIGPFARASNGRIYPLLAKLEADGLISGDDEPGQRKARKFTITAAGGERFHELMLDTVSQPRSYRELFVCKVAFFDLITPSERLYLLDHYRSFCRAHIEHIRTEAADLDRQAAAFGHGPRQQTQFAMVFKHLSAGWEQDLAWIEDLKTLAEQ